MSARTLIAKEVVHSLLRTLTPSRRTPIVHSPGLFSPTVPAEITPDLSPTERDIETAARLLCAYELATGEKGSATTKKVDIWSNIRAHQPTFFSALNSRDPQILAAYLCNMNRHDATQGTIQGYREFLNLYFNPLYRRFVARLIKDKLVLLAEAVGAIPCENPEQGVWGQNVRLSIDNLAKAIENKLGLDITPPQIDGGLLKITGSSASFHERDLNSIFTAWTLSNILKGTPSAAVCEIGAGTGRVAYWAWRMGVKSYTIIDLPHINVIQGFYIIKALPEANVHLYGEATGSPPYNSISILPTHSVEELPSNQFDLVLNQDSFPEIHPDIVRNYLLRIKEISRKWFLSINHESCPPGVADFTHIRVPDLIDETGGYQRLWRMPYWLRRGYIMELYEV